MSKCLDDELFDIYIEDGKTVIESLREIYEKGRANAIDECIALARIEIDFESQSEQKRFVEFMNQLKER